MRSLIGCNRRYLRKLADYGGSTWDHRFYTARGRGTAGTTSGWCWGSRRGCAQGTGCAHGLLLRATCTRHADMFSLSFLLFPILYLLLRTHSSLSAFPVFPHSQLLSASHIVSDSDSRLQFYRLIFAHPPLILSPSHVLLRLLLIASLPRSESTISTWTRTYPYSAHMHRIPMHRTYYSYISWLAAPR